MINGDQKACKTKFLEKIFDIIAKTTLQEKVMLINQYEAISDYFQLTSLRRNNAYKVTTSRHIAEVTT